MPTGSLSEVVNHAHAAALAASSPQDTPTQLSTSRGANNNFTGRWKNKQMLLHPPILVVVEQPGNEFGEYRCLDECEFHDRSYVIDGDTSVT